MKFIVNLSLVLILALSVQAHPGFVQNKIQKNLVLDNEAVVIKFLPPLGTAAKDKLFTFTV